MAAPKWAQDMAPVADLVAEERERREAILTVLRLFPEASDCAVAAEVAALGHRKPPAVMVTAMRRR